MAGKYTISPDGQSITCHKCGRTSHNINDVINVYCGHCHIFHDVQLPQSKCPTCGYESDAAMSKSGTNNTRPGDFGVCPKCGDVNVFNEQLVLRSATVSDMIDLPPEDMKQIEILQTNLRRARIFDEKAKKKIR